VVDYQCCGVLCGVILRGQSSQGLTPQKTSQNRPGETHVWMLAADLVAQHSEPRQWQSLRFGNAIPGLHVFALHLTSYFLVLWALIRMIHVYCAKTSKSRVQQVSTPQELSKCWICKDQKCLTFLPKTSSRCEWSASMCVNNRSPMMINTQAHAHTNAHTHTCASQSIHKLWIVIY